MKDSPRGSSIFASITAFQVLDVAFEIVELFFGFSGGKSKFLLTSTLVRSNPDCIC